MAVDGRHNETGRQWEPLRILILQGWDEIPRQGIARNGKNHNIIKWGICWFK